MLLAQQKEKLKCETLSEPKFVGREQQLKELQLYLTSVFKGKGTTLFISGEAGSGKTRLTNEFLNVAKEKEITVLSGWCLSNATIPYFPFIEAFNSSAETNETFNAVTSQILKENNNMASGQVERFENAKSFTPQVWMNQTFASVTKELLYLSTKKTTILILEDIHWADSASLALLNYISRAIISERVFVLATFRSEELNSDSEGHPLPLVETLRAMNREDLYKEIKLPSLNQEQIGKMATSVLGGKLHPSLIERLSVESHGNPLFVVESLRMLTKDLNLVKEKAGSGDYQLTN